MIYTAVPLKYFSCSLFVLNNFRSIILKYDFDFILNSKLFFYVSPELVYYDIIGKKSFRFLAYTIIKSENVFIM